MLKYLAPDRVITPETINIFKKCLLKQLAFNRQMIKNTRMAKQPCRTSWTVLRYGIIGALLVLAATPATPVNSKQRLKLFYITLPQPQKGQMERLADIRISRRRIAPRVFASTEIVFYLNKKGKVDSIGWSYAATDSLVFRPYQDSLLATEFEAGKIDGKKVEFALVARFFALGNNLGARGVVDLPVDTEGGLRDYSLALKSLANYGYQPPELVTFPPYFISKLDVEDNKEQLYKFAVLRISLDSTGAVGERSVYFTTDEDLSEMLQVASGWAEYSPATLNGVGIASEGYLFVRFFREVSSPVGQWSAAASDSIASGLDQMRVTWIPGSQFGDVAPVRKANPNLTVTLPLAYSHNVAKEALLRIGARGRVNVNDLSGLIGKTDQRIALDKLKSLPFYPAFRLVPDSARQQLTLSYLSVLGRLKLLPLDSTTYRLQTEFINDYNVVQRHRTMRQ